MAGFSPDFLAQLKSEAGSEEEEVTDEQAASVIAEILAGAKTGGATEGSEPSGERRTLLRSTANALEKAGKTARVAVAHDKSGNSWPAIEAYDAALGLYAEALGDHVLSEKIVAQIIPQMVYYLDRCVELRLGEKVAERDFEEEVSAVNFRRKALEAISARGFSTLKRGVALYRRGKSCQAQTQPGAGAEAAGAKGGDDWATLVLFTEAIECLLIYLKAPGTNAKSSPMVTACVTEMLERVEHVKAANQKNPLPAEPQAEPQAQPPIDTAAAVAPSTPPSVRSATSDGHCAVPAAKTAPDVPVSGETKPESPDVKAGGTNKGIGPLV